MNAMASLYHRSLAENLYREYTADELITLLVDTKWENRQNRNIENLIQRAGFRNRAAATDIDYQSVRNLTGGCSRGF
jgi:hypothetical protein